MYKKSKSRKPKTKKVNPRSRKPKTKKVDPRSRKPKTKKVNPRSRKPKTRKAKPRKLKTHKAKSRSRKRKTRKIKAGMGEKDCLEKCKKECMVERKTSSSKSSDSAARYLPFVQRGADVGVQDYKTAITIGLADYIKYYKVAEGETESKKIEKDFISSAEIVGIPKDRALAIWRSHI